MRIIPAICGASIGGNLVALIGLWVWEDAPAGWAWGLSAAGALALAIVGWRIGGKL